MPGLLLDTDNTFYLRAVDQTDTTSTLQRFTWFVKKPRGEVLYVRPRKTRRSSGKAQEWVIDDDLRAALDACLDLHKTPTRKDGKPGRPRVAGQHLFCTRKGQPYTPDGFASIWQRWMRKALKETRLDQRSSERSIRTFVGSHSESDQDAADRLGHSSTTTTKRHYRERATVVRPLKVKD